MEAHDEVVSAIAARVREFYEQQKAFRLYHGSTNTTRRSHRRADNIVDTSQLNNILRVDAAAKTALVEPNVPMDALVQATLRTGLVPFVVMEFPGITVGGGFSGTSGESSSFRYGPFDANIGSIEIVLPDGTVARASKTDNQEIFWGAASAFGTLGVVTMLEVPLREAKTYVRLEYSLSSGPGEMRKKIEDESTGQENDYIDAIIFSPHETVVCVGQLTNEKPAEVKPIRFRGPSDPWFYTRSTDVLKQLRKKSLEEETRTKTVTDFIPLEDYLFRYDRGSFWTAMYALQYLMLPFNRITRFVLHPWLHTQVMYRAIHKSGLFDHYMVQDVGVPYDRVEEFQSWLDQELHIYPLWICPLRIRRDDANSAHGLHSGFAHANDPNLMNFGVWGPIKGASIIDKVEFAEKNRALERKVHELNGKKWLYAHAYYTEDEFWAHYDRDSYDALRKKYKADYLPSVYDKVKVDVEAEEAAEGATWMGRIWASIWIWPLAGVWAVYSAIRGGEYLMNG